MFTIVKPGTNFDFMSKKILFLSISGIFIIFSFILIFTKGFVYGIDFTGGVEVQVKFENKEIRTANVRTAMKEVRTGDIQVQKFGDSENNEYLIRLEGAEDELDDLTKKIELTLAEKFEKESFEIRRVDMVGPKVGHELRRDGLFSVLYALLGILIYVAFRFDYKFSPGAVLALIHDVIITLGFFSLVGHQITLSTVAALLTIVGYSLNDTIVIYDRIRETMGKLKGTVLSGVINKAVNETLSRTILTTLTTLLVVIMLLIFGGSVISDFALALLVGMIAGTYSTVFIASPALLYMEKIWGGSRKNA
ncbi:MAG: protein translocase subunit SecF [Oligoflexia bacterium]|nr:protein translocase subunit SecF [Oligoflexia bacterium]